MVHHLTPGEPLADGVRRVAVAQLDGALRTIDDPDSDDHTSVHDARKRCKRVRALLRLVRDGADSPYDEVNAELRDIARLVSSARDAAAAVETHDALLEAADDAPSEADAVRAALVARRDGAAVDRIERSLPEVRDRLATVRWNVDGWTLPTDDGLEVLARGYARTYGRARDRWQAAEDTPATEVWHQWRKRLKYHRHHVGLLRVAWPPVLELREQLLHDLTDLTGEDHDLAVLHDTLLHDDLGGVATDDHLELVSRRRVALQRAALPLAARLLAATDEQHTALVLRWWERAGDEHRAGHDLDAT